MVDDITLNAGSGGDTLAADDITGVKYQIVKAALGALDSATLLDGNSGNKSAGTLRVVLATDQPALTNKLLVTPDLPSGASTAAKQPALGTAGTASADVISVQGIASMTALKVDGSGVTQPVSGTVTANPASGTIDTVTTVGTVTNVVHVDDNGGALTVDGTVAVTHAALTELASALNAEDVATAGADAGMVILARRTDTPANQSGTDGDLEIPQMSAGRLWTSSVVTGTVAVTQSGTWDEVGINDSGNSITVDNPQLSVVGGGTEAAAMRVTIASDSTGVLSVDDNGGSLTVDGTVAVSGTVAVTESGTWTVQPGNTPNTSAWLTQNTPATSGGLTTFMASGSDGSSILVATAQVVKASAGQLYGYYAYNPEAAATFVHFYNTAAASVTVGTTNPLFTLAIPAGSAANLMTDTGITFSNAGWSVAATTTAGGSSAPATGVSLVCWYK